MRRGDIWTVAGGKDYAGKPRPVVIVQDDSFDATDSITVCAFTTDETEAPLFRLPVEPNERNGLRAACRLMVDKISTVPKTKVGARVGRLDDEDILRLNQAALVFLGLAVSPRTKRETKNRLHPGVRSSVLNWRWTQSAQTGLRPAHLLLTGTITGRFANSWPFRHLWPDKRFRISAICRRLSLLDGTGLYQEGTESGGQ